MQKGRERQSAGQSEVGAGGREGGREGRAEREIAQKGEKIGQLAHATLVIVSCVRALSALRALRC